MHEEVLAQRVIESLAPNYCEAPGVVAVRVFLSRVVQADVTMSGETRGAQMKEKLERRFVERALIALSPRSKNLA